MKGYVVTIDSLNQGTDIARALRNAEAQQPPPDYIVMISDGNYSVGQNPLYIRNSGLIPVFTIGIGDTAEPFDIKITRLQAPKIAYQNKQIELRASVMVTGVDSVGLNLKLSKDDKLIAQKKLFAGKPGREYHAVFDQIPQLPGSETYQITADPMPGERNMQNNRAIAEVRVLKEKLGVAILSARADYDFKFLKLLLGSQKDLKVFPVVDIGKRSGAVLNPDSIDVVIWNQIQDTKEIPLLSGNVDLSKYPALLLVSGRPDNRMTGFMSKYVAVQPLSFSGRDIRLQVRETSAGSRFAPINVLQNTQLNTRFWQVAPPIDYNYEHVVLKSGTTVLLETTNSSGGGAGTQPVMISGSAAGKKNILLL